MNTGVDCHALFQGIFPTQGLNLCLLCLLHWQAGSLPLTPSGKPKHCINKSLYWLQGFPSGSENSLQYSCLENPMDCIVHGVTKSRTRLSDFHSQTIPWTEEPAGLQSMGSQRVGHVLLTKQQHPWWKERVYISLFMYKMRVINTYLVVVLDG